MASLLGKRERERERERERARERARESERERERARERETDRERDSERKKGILLLLGLTLLFFFSVIINCMKTFLF
jgi:hypothetical protein